MAPKGLPIGLAAVGLALGAAVWAAKPPRTSGNDAESAASGGAATFYKDVLPIVQEHCQTCHRPGQIGPFSLLDFQSARPWAQALKSVVAASKLPPWLANPQYGQFNNHLALIHVEIGTMLAWANSGVP